MMVARRLKRLEVEDSLHLMEEVAACDLSTDLEVEVEPEPGPLDLEALEDELERELDVDLVAQVDGRDEDRAEFSRLAEMLDAT